MYSRRMAVVEVAEDMIYPPSPGFGGTLIPRSYFGAVSHTFILTRFICTFAWFVP